MYMKLLLIDYLSPDGVLTSYRAFPKYDGGAVVMDRLSDVRGPTYGSSDLDVGGARIYNSDKVEILRSSTQIRAFAYDRDAKEFNFAIEHMGLDVGFSNRAEGGMYYFIGPFGWRAKQRFVSDPYDRKSTDDYKRKQFRHSLKWDTRFHSQLIEMDLRSSRGTFSFRTGGVFALADSKATFVEAQEDQGIVKRVVEDWHLRDGGGDAIKTDLADKVDWVEMKPKLFGVGININKIIKDAIAMFRGT